MDSLFPEAAHQAGGFPEPDRLGSCRSISRRGFHRIAYTEWGEPTALRVLVCVHGLTRQGRDFDRLAAALAAVGYRVVCPDLPGRGRSDRLADPEEYTLPQYAVDLTVLIAHLGVETVDWVGTSLGGLVGIVLAGQPNSPIRRLVVNDIGPYLPWAALHRIAAGVFSAPPSFDSLAAATAQFRTSLAPFGHLTGPEWEHLARHSVALRKDGRLHVLCDPGIAAAFRTSFLFNLSLWTYWDAIRCPTLVLRGIDSDLLLPRTLDEMTQRGPRAEAVEFRGCGHAPALLDAEQIGVVRDWLGRPAA